MRWVILSLFLAAAVFLVVERSTTNPWPSANLAGLVCAMFLIGIATRFPNQFLHRKTKVAVVVFCTVAITSLIGSWTLLCMETEWQYNALQTSRRRLFHTEVWASLNERATQLYCAYLSANKSISLHQTFDRISPSRSAILDSLLVSYQGPVTIQLNPDSVVFLAQARLVRGFLPTFTNLDGSNGFAQHRAIVKPTGIKYEIQN